MVKELNKHQEWRFRSFYSRNVHLIADSEQFPEYHTLGAWGEIKTSTPGHYQDWLVLAPGERRAPSLAVIRTLSTGVWPTAAVNVRVVDAAPWLVEKPALILPVILSPNQSARRWRHSPRRMVLWRHNDSAPVAWRHRITQRLVSNPTPFWRVVYYPAPRYQRPHSKLTTPRATSSPPKIILKWSYEQDQTRQGSWVNQSQQPPSKI